jgi:hypothetical protein
MMRDVDGLAHFDHPLVAQHLQVALQLYLTDRAARPAACKPALFCSHNPLKCVSQVSPIMAAPSPTCSPTVTTMVLHPAPLVAPLVAASYPLHALLTNLPVRFRPLPGIPATDPSIAPSSTTCTGSNLLLSNRTVAWLFITPQLGAIPFALASHSDLFPVASVVIQPTSFRSTPLCRAALPDCFFVPYTLSQFSRHMNLLRTPAVFDPSGLDVTLNWFVDCYTRVTGVDCSCPFPDLSAQLAWLDSVFLLVELLASRFHPSCSPSL